MFSFIRGVLKPYFNAEGKYIEPRGDQEVFLAKRFDSNNKPAKTYLPVFFNVIDTQNPVSLEAVSRTLRKYATDKDVAMLRGIPLADTQEIRRNTGTFNCKMVSPIFHMDIDGIPTDTFNLEKQADVVLNILSNINPSMFSTDMQFVIKASGSARIKKGIRFHMYLLMNRPLSNAQLKYLSIGINKTCMEKFGYDLLDPSVYDQVHIMYTANPVFTDSSTDPFADTSRFFDRLTGVAVRIPEYVAEVTPANTIVLEKQHYSYIEGIEGLHCLPNSDMKLRMERIISANDNVFMRHSISLYAAAIEHGVDIGWLDNLVIPHIEEYSRRKKNSKPVDIYIQNAKNAALKIILGRSIRVVDGDIDVSSNPSQANMLPIKSIPTNSNSRDKYLHITSLPPENTITFIKASLGTGKTTTVQEWLSSGMIEGRVLAVTNTVSLVEGNAKKLSSGVYNKLKDFSDFKYGSIKRMSTTIHSLHRFRESVQSGGLELLFIDEADAVMNDILFSEVVKERERCVSALSLAMRKAKYVVLSDGDISPETVEAYARLCDPVKSVNIYKHDRKMLEGATARELPDEQSVWAALQGSLDIGEKCILVSDCSPDELHLKGAILRETTGANVKEVHRNSTKDSDVKEILTFGNQALMQQGIEGLLCSPSVTSGVDFNYFDTVFLITRDSGIHTPNLRFQALRRDRGAKAIYYYTAPQTEGFKTGFEMYDEQLGWAYRCRKIFAKRKEGECKRYMSTFRILLRDQGCRVIIDPTKWGALEVDSKLTAELKQEKVDAIMASTPMFTQRRHADAYDIKQDIVRYYEDISDLSGVNEDSIVRFLKDKPVDRARFFHKIVKFFWDDLVKCKRTISWEPLRIAIQTKPHIWYQYTGRDARMEPWRLKLYIKQMGMSFKHPGDMTEITHWYRVFCKCNSIQIPIQFQTPDEKALTMDMENELD